MKKIVLSAILSLLVLFIGAKEASAACLFVGNAGYAACAGSTSAIRCQNPTACCNQPGDVCPTGNATPDGTPTPPNPNTNPHCGSTSQPCCSGGTCDSGGVQLFCTTTAAGGRCLSQSQIDVMEGARSGGADTNTGESILGGGGCGATELNTAIGCIPALGSSSDLMGFILRWAIGVGGGIAFLLILFSGFQIMTSQGDPQRLKAGQELMTAAISGIIMLIFSVFILRVVGVNILGIF